MVRSVKTPVKIFTIAVYSVHVPWVPEGFFSQGSCDCERDCDPAKKKTSGTQGIYSVGEVIKSVFTVRFVFHACGV